MLDTAWMILRFKSRRRAKHGIMTTCVRIGIVASMMGVCTKTIRRWDASGKITCTRTLGGHRRRAEERKWWKRAKKVLVGIAKVKEWLGRKKVGGEA